MLSHIRFLESILSLIYYCPPYVSVSFISFHESSLKPFFQTMTDANSIMSSDEASPSSLQSRAFPPLTNEARQRFFDLVRAYCIAIPKSQDSYDVHLETVRFSAAIDVRPCTDIKREQD